MSRRTYGNYRNRHGGGFYGVGGRTRDHHRHNNRREIVDGDDVARLWFGCGSEKLENAIPDHEIIHHLKEWGPCRVQCNFTDQNDVRQRKNKVPFFVVEFPDRQQASKIMMKYGKCGKEVFVIKDYPLKIEWSSHPPNQQMKTITWKKEEFKEEKKEDGRVWDIVKEKENSDSLSPSSGLDKSHGSKRRILSSGREILSSGREIGAERYQLLADRNTDRNNRKERSMYSNNSNTLGGEKPDETEGKSPIVGREILSAKDVFSGLNAKRRNVEILDHETMALFEKTFGGTKQKTGSPNTETTHAEREESLASPDSGVNALSRSTAVPSPDSVNALASPDDSVVEGEIGPLNKDAAALAKSLDKDLVNTNKPNKPSSPTNLNRCSMKDPPTHDYLNFPLALFVENPEWKEEFFEILSELNPRIRKRAIEELSNDSAIKKEASKGVTNKESTFREIKERIRQNKYSTIYELSSLSSHTKGKKDTGIKIDTRDYRPGSAARQMKGNDRQGRNLQSKNDEERTGSTRRGAGDDRNDWSNNDLGFFAKHDRSANPVTHRLANRTANRSAERASDTRTAAEVLGIERPGAGRNNKSDSNAKNSNEGNDNQRKTLGFSERTEQGFTAALCESRSASLSKLSRGLANGSASNVLGTACKEAKKEAKSKNDDHHDIYKNDSLGEEDMTSIADVKKGRKFADIVDLLSRNKSADMKRRYSNSDKPEAVDDGKAKKGTVELCKKGTVELKPNGVDQKSNQVDLKPNQNRKNRSRSKRRRCNSRNSVGRNENDRNNSRHRKGGRNTTRGSRESRHRDVRRSRDARGGRNRDSRRRDSRRSKRDDSPSSKRDRDFRKPKDARDRSDDDKSISRSKSFLKGASKGRNPSKANDAGGRGKGSKNNKAVNAKEVNPNTSMTKVDLISKDANFQDSGENKGKVKNTSSKEYTTLKDLGSLRRLSHGKEKESPGGGKQSPGREKRSPERTKQSPGTDKQTGVILISANRSSNDRANDRILDKDNESPFTSDDDEIVQPSKKKGKNVKNVLNGGQNQKAHNRKGNANINSNGNKDSAKYSNANNGNGVGGNGNRIGKKKQKLKKQNNHKGGKNNRGNKGGVVRGGDNSKISNNLGNGSDVDGGMTSKNGGTVTSKNAAGKGGMKRRYDSLDSEASDYSSNKSSDSSPKRKNSGKGRTAFFDVNKLSDDSTPRRGNVAMGNGNGNVKNTGKNGGKQLKVKKGSTKRSSTATCDFSTESSSEDDESRSDSDSVKGRKNLSRRDRDRSIRDRSRRRNTGKDRRDRSLRDNRSRDKSRSCSLRNRDRNRARSARDADESSVRGTGKTRSRRERDRDGSLRGSEIPAGRGKDSGRGGKDDREGGKDEEGLQDDDRKRRGKDEGDDRKRDDDRKRRKKELPSMDGYIGAKPANPGESSTREERLAMMRQVLGKDPLVSKTERQRVPETERQRISERSFEQIGGNQQQYQEVDYGLNPHAHLPPPPQQMYSPFSIPFGGDLPPPPHPQHIIGQHHEQHVHIPGQQQNLGSTHHDHRQHQMSGVGVQHHNGGHQAAIFERPLIKRALHGYLQHGEGPHQPPHHGGTLHQEGPPPPQNFRHGPYYPGQHQRAENDFETHQTPAQRSERHGSPGWASNPTQASHQAPFPSKSRQPEQRDRQQRAKRERSKSDQRHERPESDRRDRSKSNQQSKTNHQNEKHERKEREDQKREDQKRSEQETLERQQKEIESKKNQCEQEQRREQQETEQQRRQESQQEIPLENRQGEPLEQINEGHVRVHKDDKSKTLLRDLDYTTVENLYERFIKKNENLILEFQGQVIENCDAPLQQFVDAINEHLIADGVMSDDFILLDGIMIEGLSIQDWTYQAQLPDGKKEGRLYLANGEVYHQNGTYPITFRIENTTQGSMENKPIIEFNILPAPESPTTPVNQPSTPDNATKEFEKEKMKEDESITVLVRLPTLQSIRVILKVSDFGMPVSELNIHHVADKVGQETSVVMTKEEIEQLVCKSGGIEYEFSTTLRKIQIAQGLAQGRGHQGRGAKEESNEELFIEFIEDDW